MLSAELRAASLESEVKSKDKEIQGLKLQIMQLGLGQASSTKQESEFKLTIAAKDKEIYEHKVAAGKREKLV
jgi:hypothetical protein